jgi:hypothetical protein
MSCTRSSTIAAPPSQQAAKRSCFSLYLVATSTTIKTFVVDVRLNVTWHWSCLIKITDVKRSSNKSHQQISCAVFLNATEATTLNKPKTFCHDFQSFGFLFACFVFTHAHTFKKPKPKPNQINHPNQTKPNQTKRWHRMIVVVVVVVIVKSVHLIS